MLGKKKINLVHSLAQKRFRQKENLFLAEGNKIVCEVLNSRFRIKELIATQEFLSHNDIAVSDGTRITEAAPEEIKKASLLKNPQQSIAMCELPAELPLPDKMAGLAYYLDDIQDPGNLGTIIRIADWFGMDYLFCSPGTVDVFNPKVIQASMGSFCRVKVIYTPFDYIVSMSNRSGVSIFGTYLNGTSIYSPGLPKEAIIVLGNEGNGISKATDRNITKRLTIPSYSKEKKGAESLNVAIAAGIIGSEFRRQAFE